MQAAGRSRRRRRERQQRAPVGHADEPIADLKRTSEALARGIHKLEAFFQPDDTLAEVNSGKAKAGMG